ncbi:carbohydrate kinase family protein [Patescibacteria group bacterium]|nr:carbohydrate kinase family protein [Patescibacteria group bacterium]
MKFDVITIGSSLLDIAFYTNECKLIKNNDDLLCQKMLAFEYGAKVKVDKIVNSFGGGAANAAVSFSRLGLKAGIITSIGDDERGDQIIKNFKEQQVGTQLVQRQNKTETGYSFLITSSIHSKEHVIFPSRGASSKLQINNKEIQILKSKTKWIYITSLSGNWKDTLNKIFETSHSRIAWNIGGEQLKSGIRGLSDYLKRTFILILNKDEALELILSSQKYKKLTKAHLSEPENLIKLIKQLGPSIVLITSGNKGAHAYDGQKIYYQAPFKEKKKEDTTGVGDAFGSSFVTGLEKFDNNLKKSLSLAARNTAKVIAQVGAQNGLIKL